MTTRCDRGNASHPWRWYTINKTCQASQPNVLMNQHVQAEALPLSSEAPPLRVDEGGVVRIGKSRVTLDLIVSQYENGFEPEDMVRAYDSLELADVHSAIAYYLRHREE